MTTPRLRRIVADRIAADREELARHMLSLKHGNRYENVAYRIYELERDIAAAERDLRA